MLFDSSLLLLSTPAGKTIKTRWTTSLKKYFLHILEPPHDLSDLVPRKKKEKIHKRGRREDTRGGWERRMLMEGNRDAAMEAKIVRLASRAMAGD